MMESGLKDQGNAAYANGNFAEALELYTQAINETACKDDLSMLYSNRSATDYCLGNYEQALSDANKAIELSPTWGKGYARKGSALILLERYEEAHKAFSCGLVYDPKNIQISKGIAECEIELAKLAQKKRQIAQLSDDFDCVLCMKLMFEPVTTPCGHSFCRNCLVRALDHNSACPLCRTVLHISHNHPINVTLQSIIERNFKAEFEVRQKEAKDEKEQDLANLPLFLLNVVAFPGQPFPLHIFEPRYRLMLRRCLEGQRRFGLVCHTQTQPNGAEVGCILDIKNSQMLPDGRSYVDTVGTKRFKILNKWITDGYMCGKVVIIQDEVDESTKAQAKKCADEIREYIGNLMDAPTSGSMKHLVDSFKEPGSLVNTDDLEQFSFWVASRMPLTTQVAVDVIQTTNTLHRLQTILHVIQGGSAQQQNCCIQ